MTSKPQPTTVLIVEDEPDLADLFAQFLKETYTVLTAYNGTEALEMMSDEVDIVLLDRRMPGLSGEEVLEAIRSEDYSCRVAMVTAVNPDMDIIDMGFDDYVTKPATKEDLHTTVERLLELNTYDDLMTEYYQLASKKAALEIEKEFSGLSEHEEFNRLTDRLDELDTKLRETEGASKDFDLRSLLDR